MATAGTAVTGETGVAVMIELHSTTCRCRGASYMWQADDRACGCKPDAVPDDAIVLGISEWLFFKKPRNAEESTTRGARARRAA